MKQGGKVTIEGIEWRLIWMQPVFECVVVVKSDIRILDCDVGWYL
jgi:hypothetical protein